MLLWICKGNVQAYNLNLARLVVIHWFLITKTFLLVYLIFANFLLCVCFNININMCVFVFAVSTTVSFGQVVVSGCIHSIDLMNVTHFTLVCLLLLGSTNDTYIQNWCSHAMWNYLYIYILLPSSSRLILQWWAFFHHLLDLILITMMFWAASNIFWSKSLCCNVYKMYLCIFQQNLNSIQTSWLPFPIFHHCLNHTC